MIRIPDELKTQAESLSNSASLATAARREMECHMARLRIQRALCLNIPTVSEVSLKVAHKVLVWREELLASRIGESRDPYDVVSIDRSAKLAYIRLGSA